MRRLVFDYLIETCGDLPLDDFALANAEAFRAVLIRRFRPVTAASYLKMVRPPFRWWQYRAKVFVDHWADLPKIKQPKKRPKMYADAEVEALLQGAGQDELMQARVVLMISTGMRRGEALNLTDADVDWEAETVTVQPKDETDRTWAWVAKDNETRTLPLTAQARDLLWRRRLALPRAQPYLLLTENRYNYLIWLQMQGKLTARMRKCPDDNWRPFRRLRERTGVTGRSIKHFRSTCLTNWLRDGLDLASVRDLAGHSSIETTEAYLVPDNGAVTKARALSDARLARVANPD
ncbi:MAG: site-specific integrase [Anaerolineae bacterium]|nr:site-specific integrase [Anaerolineae bacterium]